MTMRLTEKGIPEIERILKHPSVFYWAKDDGLISPVDGMGQAALQAGILLQPYQDTLFIFQKKNCITWEVHTAIISGMARNHGISSAIDAVLWMFANTDMQKVTTWVPSFHEAAILFASMCGLNKEGCSPKSYLHNGLIYDVLYFGATKEELLRR